MLVMTPSDENEMRRMLTTGYHFEGPAAVRYPRGSGPNASIEPALEPLEIGKAVVRRQGSKVALLVFGVQLPEALQVGEALDATVVDMRFVKPLDEALLRELAGSHELLVTVEENSIMGGAGSAVAEFLAAEGVLRPILHLGLPDYYVEHAKPSEMLAECGLDAAGIEVAVRKRRRHSAKHDVVSLVGWSVTTLRSQRLWVGGVGWKTAQHFPRRGSAVVDGWSVIHPTLATPSRPVGRQSRSLKSNGSQPRNSKSPSIGT